MTNPHSVAASAPGKLVLSGEYAVLAGGLALVLAVNRRVRCRIDAGDSAWQFESTGFAGTVRHPLSRLLDPAPLPASDPARLCQHLVSQMSDFGGDPARLPAGARVRIDSSACYHDGHKLGVGSSAAVCVALGGALSAWLAPNAAPAAPAAGTLGLPWMLAAHRAAQAGRGSGLDVAAAFHGGIITYLLRFNGTSTARPITLPAGLHLSFVHTGSSTVTASRLAQFERWRDGDTPPPLAALIEACGRVAGAALRDADRFVAQLRGYVNALAALDAAASLGIFSAPHQLLTRIGHDTGVVYKPSGAGGGDMGIAFGTDPAAVARFEAQARTAGFLLPPMEPEQDGIKVDSAQP